MYFDNIGTIACYLDLSINNIECTVWFLDGWSVAKKIHL